MIFPGLDPFLESQAWEDFHHHLIEEIYRVLAPGLRPRYVVRVEERVYVEYLPDEHGTGFRPDIVVSETLLPSSQQPIAAPVLEPSAVITLPLPEQKQEAFLTIRHSETLAVVTVIEILSLSNKRANSSGRQEYLRKREAVLMSDAHLIEIDLLRGGERLPSLQPYPNADYYVLVSRADRRPRAEVYCASLRSPLPRFPVPLAYPDPDRPIDLQAIYQSVYELADYSGSLQYDRPVEPALSEQDAAWVAQCLQNQKDKTFSG